MKKIIFYTLALALFFTTSAMAHCGSCGIGDNPTAEETKKAMMHDDMHKKSEMMAEELGLTDEQASKVSALMAEKMEKKKAVKESSKEQMDEIREEYEAKLKEILTPEQYEKHSAKMEEMKDGKGEFMKQKMKKNITK